MNFLNVQFKKHTYPIFLFLDNEVLEGQGLFFVYEQIGSCAVLANTSHWLTSTCSDCGYSIPQKREEWEP